MPTTNKIPLVAIKEIFIIMSASATKGNVSIITYEIKHTHPASTMFRILNGNIEPKS